VAGIGARGCEAVMLLFQGVPVQAIHSSAGAVALALALACRPAVGPESGADAPSTLMVSGRTLLYSGRNELKTQRADDRPLSQQVVTQVRLTTADGPARTWRSDVLVLTADDDRALQPSPYERRQETLHVDPDTLEVRVERRAVQPRIAPGAWGPPSELRLSDDGFGLNFAARRTACQFSTGLPRAVFTELAAGREVDCPFDFHLVPGDPGADRSLAPAGSDPPPTGAEIRIHGRTTLRPLGREPYRVARRFLAPLPADGTDPPPRGRPDESVELGALRVQVRMDLVLERLVPVAGQPQQEERRDDWTLTVLDRPDEPLILVSEGAIRAVGNPASDPRIRTLDATRRLEVVEESRLDASPPAP